MKVTVLVDNNTFIDRYFYGEPGLSFYIEADGTNILFDLGYSDIFIRNAEKMGINLREVDIITFSHGHMDHTWGLDPIIRLFTEAKLEKRFCKAPTIIAHPRVLKTKLYEEGEIGSMISVSKLQRHFGLRFSKEPVWITENLVFLGQIDRVFDFEDQPPIGEVVLDQEGNTEDDYLLDDTALVYKTPDGLVIMAGCAHSGICNIIEQAKRICGDDRVLDVIGGFHLLEPSAHQLQGTVEYFRKLGPQAIHACHCTDFASKIALAQVVNVQEVGVGLSLTF
ncbi:MBL fold metallo-hydrolase [Brevibacillus dissolubilis]|uniref:MBL fold metallo-hydrolase n=1 Tax=Brevibacillus dissolubilis TaxID=1844116 RepID=UPI00111709E3|nr:MBL fold metallo-hydrolase [Brevibacillus dissolubilis]